jgi:hypothetical protein
MSNPTIIESSPGLSDILGAYDFGGTVTGSVARSGSFKGAALIVGAGTDEAAAAKQLRDVGIFVEGGIAPVALASGAPPEERKATGPAEAPVAIEKPDHKKEHRHADK